MKDHGDMDKSESVKKFRYAAPSNQTATIQAFPNESASCQNSFDPEQAWSIRKDFSVNFSSPKSSRVFGYGSTAAKYHSPKSSLYSRHAGHAKSSGHNVMNANTNNSNGTNLDPLQTSWQSGTSRHSQLNRVKSNISTSSSKEFNPTFESSKQQPFTPPKDHKIGRQPMGNLHKSYPSPNFEKKKNSESNFSNKYNSAFYNF